MLLFDACALIAALNSEGGVSVVKDLLQNAVEKN
jgi:hypothetical protein